MRDTDTQLLVEAYKLVLEGKALTPEQIAKKAKAGGSEKSPDMLSTSNKEGTATEQPSDNNPENIDQDNKNTEVKDPYVLKETEEGEEQVDGGEKEGGDVQGEAAIGPQGHPTEQPTGAKPQKPAPQTNEEDIVYLTSMDILGDLQTVEKELKTLDPEAARRARIDLSLSLKRIIDDFRNGRLPADEDVEGDPKLISHQSNSFPPQSA